MNAPELAPNFCQVAWVVKDIAAAEKFFIETMGIKKFFKMENFAAKDSQGTYRGQTGDWVIHLYLAYAGDTQVELIQNLSGKSIYQESLEAHGDAVQHLAYWLDDSEYDSAAERLESAGYPLVQSLELPALVRVGYFDTCSAIGVMTEIVGARKEGHELLQNIKDGNF